MPFGLEYFGALAGGGASGGAGAAGILGASSMLGPVGIGLGVAGLAMGLFSSMSQNAEIERKNEAIGQAAQSQFAAINANTLSTYRQFYDQTNTAGERARSAAATLQNGMGFTSGQSLNEFVAQRMVDTDQDQYARAAALTDYVAQAEWQKKSIAANASAGMSSGVNPLIAGIQGGIQGLQLGSSLESAIGSFQRTTQINTALKGLEPLATAGDPTAIAQMQAIQAGINPQAAMMPNSPYIRPFIQQQQLMSMQLGAARANYGASMLRLNTINSEYNMVNDRLLQYMK